MQVERCGSSCKRFMGGEDL